MLIYFSKFARLTFFKSPAKAIKSEVYSPRKPELVFPNLKSYQRPLQDENLSAASDHVYQSVPRAFNPKTTSASITHQLPSVATSPLIPPGPKPTTTVTQNHKSREVGRGDNKPFARYYIQYCRKVLPEKSISENKMYDMAWNSWCQLSPADRAPFFAREESFYPSNDNSNDNHSPEKTGANDDEGGKPDFCFDYEKQFQANDLPEGPIDDPQPNNFQLQTFIADASLEVLETSIDQGVKFLDDLKRPLRDNLEKSQDATQWVEQIEKLQKQAVKTRTIIGK